MIYHIEACENFQKVCVEVELDTPAEVEFWIRTLRTAIKKATSDVATAQAKPTPSKAVTSRPVTPNQADTLRRLGVNEKTISTLKNFDEASELIGELSGVALRNRNN